MKLVDLFESEDYHRWLLRKFRELVDHPLADLFTITLDTNEHGLHIYVRERDDIRELKLKNLNELNLKEVFIYEDEFPFDHSMYNVKMSYKTEESLITPDECFSFFMTSSFKNAVAMDYDTLTSLRSFFCMC